MKNNEIKFQGVSIGGFATNIRFPDLNFMFDIGICQEETCYIDNLLITHGHPDHAGAIISYLFQRKLRGLSIPNIYLPNSLLLHLKSSIESYAKIHKSSYPVNWHPLDTDDTFKINKKLEFKALVAAHSIETFCYQLFISGIPFLAYTGDTTIDIFRINPNLIHTRYLFCECTYTDPYHTVEIAKEFNHIHLNEILKLDYNTDIKELILLHRFYQYSEKQYHKSIKDLLKHNKTDLPIRIFQSLI